MKNLIVFCMLVSAVAFNFGCSSTTMITSSDKDAKIYIDGQMMGKGMVSYSDTKIVGSTTQIMLKKDGCDPMTYSMSRSEEFDAGACAGGVFVLVPFLWIERYHPNHNFEYECKSNKTGAVTPSPLRVSSVAK